MMGDLSHSLPYFFSVPYKGLCNDGDGLVSLALGSYLTISKLPYAQMLSVHRFR